MRGLSVWVIVVWGMAFALLIANVGVSLYNIEVLIANDRAVTHSRDVNALIEDLISAIKDEEIGQRPMPAARPSRCWAAAPWVRFAAAWRRRPPET